MFRRMTKGGFQWKSAPQECLTAFTLACYTSVTGRMEEAKVRLRQAIDLDKDIRRLAFDDEVFDPPGRVLEKASHWARFKPVSNGRNSGQQHQFDNAKKNRD